jgi:hypothetical protein
MQSQKDYHISIKYLCTTTNSDSVVLLIFNFCLEDLPCKIPVPKHITPPVCPFISLCITCEASTQTKRSSILSAPITHLSFMVPFMKPKHLFNFRQSSSSLFDTLVIKNDTTVSKSGVAHFIIKSNLATTE